VLALRQRFLAHPTRRKRDPRATNSHPTTPLFIAPQTGRSKQDARHAPDPAGILPAKRFAISATNSEFHIPAPSARCSGAAAAKTHETHASIQTSSFSTRKKKPAVIDFTVAHHAAGANRDKARWRGTVKKIIYKDWNVETSTLVPLVLTSRQTLHSESLKEVEKIGLVAAPGVRKRCHQQNESCGDPCGWVARAAPSPADARRTSDDGKRRRDKRYELKC
jgi:hypothetical protein